MNFVRRLTMRQALHALYIDGRSKGKMGNCRVQPQLGGVVLSYRGSTRSRLLTSPQSICISDWCSKEVLTSGEASRDLIACEMYSLGNLLLTC